MKDIKQDLIDRLLLLRSRFDRLLLLRSRYEVASHTTDETGNREIELYAEVIERGLHDGAESAVRAVRAIVDPADMSTAAFWATPLGVLLFAAGGFTAEEIPQTLAASVLGCSRQYVSEMVKSGKLPTSRYGVRGGMVETDAVRRRLIRKLDKLVN